MNYRLLKGLKCYKDLKLSAILFNKGKVADEFRNIGISVRIADENKLNFFQLAKNVKEIAKELDPDVIHSHRQKENIIAYFASKSRNNIKLVCTQHGMPEPIKDKYKILKRFVLSNIHLYMLSKYFSYVIVVSEDMRISFVEEHGFNKKKILLIHNGTEIPEQAQLLKEREYFIIGSVGRLFPVKDYQLMVKIAKEIVPNIKNIGFELAGEGPDRDSIVRLIRESKIEQQFKLTGFISDISTFYNKLDLYINTSIHEGLPMSVLEAMSYGIPVIAPNVGGFKEIIDTEKQGYLINYRDPKLFAEKCIKLYNNRKLLLELGAASRDKIIKKFSLNAMAEKYYEIYQSL